MILDFDKPQKISSTEDHNNKYSSDSGIAGTYVSNMSDDDKNKWKAKHIKGDDERIEIRKTIEGVQLLIIVYKKPNPVKWDYKKQEEYNKRHNDIKISMNGKLDLTFVDYSELQQAIQEAIFIMK